MLYAAQKDFDSCKTDSNVSYCGSTFRKRTKSIKSPNSQKIDQCIYLPVLVKKGQSILHTVG